MNSIDHDPLDIKGQEEVEHNRNVKAYLAQETEEADIKWLMSSKRGRRIIWRLLDQAGVFRTVFNTNALQMSYNEGYRNGGLRTLAAVQLYCPELYSIMQKENVDGRHTDGRS